MAVLAIKCNTAKPATPLIPDAFLAGGRGSFPATQIGVPVPAAGVQDAGLVVVALARVGTGVLKQQARDAHEFRPINGDRTGSLKLQ